ncbi:MAG: TlpA family protein disulfide reductase [Gemmatimonadaceae bacterium]
MKAHRLNATMSISNFNPLVILVSAGPWLVGATFLWAGFVKAISPHVFEQHLYKLGSIPRRHVPNFVTLAAALEAGWGAGLILGVAPTLLLPITAFALVALTAISWWGVRSGRTTDCGCYGGYVVPSLAQSIALNTAFVALIIIAWITQPEKAGSQWKLVAALAIALIAGTLAAASARFLKKNGRFMIDLSPLKIGRAWRGRWGAKIPDDNGERLVSFLGPECPHCKQWVRVLNVIDKAPGLPRVMGVVAASGEKLDEFVTTSGIQFPMHTIPQTLMSRLVWGVPTTVLVANGKIQKQWSGQMSPEFFQRFRDAFFPTAGPAATQPPTLLST